MVSQGTIFHFFGTHSLYSVAWELPSTNGKFYTVNKRDAWYESMHCVNVEKKFCAARAIHQNTVELIAFELKDCACARIN